MRSGPPSGPEQVNSAAARSVNSGPLLLPSSMRDCLDQYGATVNVDGLDTIEFSLASMSSPSLTTVTV